MRRKKNRTQNVARHLRTRYYHRVDFFSFFSHIKPETSKMMIDDDLIIWRGARGGRYIYYENIASGKRYKRYLSKSQIRKRNKRQKVRHEEQQRQQQPTEVDSHDGTMIDDEPDLLPDLDVTASPPSPQNPFGVPDIPNPIGASPLTVPQVLIPIPPPPAPPPPRPRSTSERKSSWCAIQ